MQLRPLTSIRQCRLPEDLVPLTDLLHRAYADLAARGLQYLASHQSVEITERRIRAGCCFVAEDSGQIVGTITIRRSTPDAELPAYREKGLMIFGQFGVEPRARGTGIGRALYDRAQEYAVSNGATAMALDTAVSATELIQMYRRWGYREIARHRWGATNYESVVMRKELGTPLLGKGECVHGNRH